MGAVFSTDEGEAWDHFAKVVSSIDPIFECGEITWGVLFPRGAVGFNQRGLDAAERGVDPLERWRLGALRARASDDRRVLASNVGHGCETFQAVGSDLAAAIERRAGEREFAERLDAPQDDLMRLTVARSLDRRDDRRLTWGAAGRAGMLGVICQPVACNWPCDPVCPAIDPFPADRPVVRKHGLTMKIRTR